MLALPSRKISNFANLFVKAGFLVFPTMENSFLMVLSEKILTPKKYFCPQNFLSPIFTKNLQNVSWVGKTRFSEVLGTF